ncbi:MAG: colanic acid/amylovoran biosynthesis glycosyltransferase [Acidobacteriaceae bacterium]|nr:colanic acid/amylovoran biosynthesis glycosyltransferase [Acidobacteriaceae bacterium]
MNTVLVFAERMLPSTQTFIPLQVDELRRYTAQYAGLIPADRNFTLPQEPILLARNRSRVARCRRELYRWLGVAPRFHASMQRMGPQLIHAHFAEGASPALFMSNRLNLPLILHLRGGAELMPDTELRRHLFQLPFLAYRRQLWQRASLFLCVSQYIREKAIRAGFPEEKVRVQYTGMNCSAFASTLPLCEKDPNLVLYVGRLVPYKGCDYLLHAMKLVQQQRPKARLVVIGDGTFRASLERLNGELDVGATFLGELPQRTARTWLEKARVFCGPSVTLEGGMSEAFGNVFSESQAMGVPVVSFRHGGIPETMQEGVTGLLAPERDVELLAAHLTRYLDDHAFWAQSREEGMRWVRQHFDVRSQTAKLEAIYDRVIREFRPGSRCQVAPAE